MKKATSKQSPELSGDVSASEPRNPENQLYQTLAKENERLKKENESQARIISGNKETIKWLMERHKDERDILQEKIKKLEEELASLKNLKKEAPLSKKRSSLYFALNLDAKIKNKSTFIPTRPVLPK